MVSSFRSPVTLIFASAVAAGASSVSSAQTHVFVDATERINITSEYDFPGENNVPLRMRSGGAVGDFDRDGDQDLFVLTGGTLPDALYINQGDGTFIDEAASRGVARAHFGSGAAVGDVNGDGWLDLYVTSLGPSDGEWAVGMHLLYINNGGGDFTERAAEAGVHMTSAEIPDGFGASFGDYDLDGDLDLAVAGWMPGALGNRLFRNDGTGRFTDVTESAIPFDLSGTRGFSPQFQDMDGDRYPELLWVADFNTSRYFINNGDGTFADFTAGSGTAMDSNGMGSEIADFDNDGLPDWYVTSIDTSQEATRSGNMLYINQGGHVFVERAADAGVNMGGWGWGADAADFDHDGREDLVWTNGWIVYPVWQTDPTYVAYNAGAADFDQTADTGITHTANGRGLLTFDCENDGDRDVVIFSTDVPTAVFVNELTDPQSQHWLRVFLDTSNNPRLAPDGIGAQVTVRTGDHVQRRWISASTNYLAQSELSAHFGLAEAGTVDELRVTWQDGTTTIRSNIPANQTLTIEAPCPADLADPIGQLDVLDVMAFFDRAGRQDPRVDLAPQGGDGVIDASDAWEYLRYYKSGCR